MAEDTREIVYHNGSQYYIIREGTAIYELEDTTKPSITKLVQKSSVLTSEEFEAMKLTRPFGYINYTL